MGQESALSHPNKVRIPAAIMSFLLFVFVGGAVLIAFEDKAFTEPAVTRAGTLGEVIFSRWVIPVEVVSILLLSALIGGIAAVKSGMAKGKEAKIHAEALRELANSFGMEVAPLVVEIEGETVRLSGTREEQYTAWRELLGRIYATETGLPQDPNTASELPVEESTGH